MNKPIKLTAQELEDVRIRDARMGEHIRTNGLLDPHYSALARTMAQQDVHSLLRHIDALLCSEVSEEALDALEVLFEWSRAYADTADTWGETRQGDPNTVALHEMISKTAAVEQALGWVDGIRPTEVN